MGGKTSAATPEAKNPPADNNKRLAVLEGGVSALIVALAANNVPVPEGVDPIDHAIVVIKGQAAQLAELTAQLEKGATPIRELEKLADFLLASYPEAITDGSAADVAIKVLGEQLDEIGELSIDVAELEAKLAAYKPAGGTVPAPIERTRPATARDFGPTFGELERAELGALVESGEQFEVGFSNGDYEIVELAPVAIAATDLRPRAGGYIVEKLIFVRAGDWDDRIHGAALLRDGEQIAYCAFPRPLPINARQERRFERSIVFTGVAAKAAA